MTEKNSRIIPSGAFWLSQANTEFQGNNWASNVLAKANKPAPRWLSNLRGMSALTLIQNPPGLSQEFSIYWNAADNKTYVHSRYGPYGSTVNMPLFNGRAYLRYRNPSGVVRVTGYTASGNNFMYTSESYVTFSMSYPARAEVTLDFSNSPDGSGQTWSFYIKYFG